MTGESDSSESLSLPRLDFADTHPASSSALGSDGPSITWTDGAGQVIGHSGVRGEIGWIELLGVAVYRFHLASGGVEATPAAGSRRELVIDAFWRSVMPHVLQARGIQVLHASAFTSGGDVVGLCGVSGVGKSTLAQGMAQKGYPTWADDALVFRRHARGWVSLRVPFHLRTTESPLAEEVPISSWEVDHGSPAIGALRTLVLLRRLERSRLESRGGFHWRRLEPRQAFTELLPHAYWLDIGDANHRRQMVEGYMGIAQEVPVFECTFVANRERLADLLDFLETNAVLA